jgi:drug/metabolite transporter (DMT)-like permease
LQVNSRLAALGAIVLWSSLASLATLIPNVPVFLKTGIGLLTGSLISLPLARFQPRQLLVQPKILLLGVYGLFGYHAALFIALGTSPSVQANLVNYLWPLLIVLLAPLFSRNNKLSLRVVLGGLMGFVGASVAILSGSTSDGLFYSGYLFAFLAAVIWSTYSLATNRVGSFPTPAVGLFALVAGLLSLAMHFIFETPVALSGFDWMILILLGLGPLGAAFYFWDYAIKRSNPQEIGLLSFLTPLLSTGLLLVITGQSLTWLLAIAAALIVGGSLIGRARQP